MTQKLEFKVGLFITITTLLIVASIGYVFYKKGIFAPVHTYTLSSRTGESLEEGMPVVFGGIVGAILWPFRAASPWLGMIAVSLLMGYRPGGDALDWLVLAGFLLLATIAVTWLSVACGLVSNSVEVASNIPMPLMQQRATATVLDGSERVEEVARMLAGDVVTDRASLEGNRNLTLRIRDRERKLIVKIDEALGRIDDGSYGKCEECGQDIGIERLKARPVTTLCIECKSLQEAQERKLRVQ